MITTADDSAVLNAIMDAAVDAMIVSDETGLILRANAAAADLFQFNVADMQGQSVNMLMPEALAALHDGFMAHHLATGEQRVIGKGRDVEGRRSDGSGFPAHVGGWLRKSR